jgi:hypothetical protein
MFSDETFEGISVMHGPCLHLILLNFIPVIMFGAKATNYEAPNYAAFSSHVVFSRLGPDILLNNHSWFFPKLYST